MKIGKIKSREDCIKELVKLLNGLDSTKESHTDDIVKIQTLETILNSFEKQRNQTIFF